VVNNCKLGEKKNVNVPGCKTQEENRKEKKNGDNEGDKTLTRRI
jgi:hypothetical protein